MSDMNSPPGYGPGAQGPVTGLSPEQLASLQGQQDRLSQRARQRMSGYRIVCGIVWGVLAIGIGAGGIGEVSIGNIGGAVLCFVIAVPAGWYDYRIWTRKARRLWLII
jgi:hypothetical protein